MTWTQWPFSPTFAPRQYSYRHVHCRIKARGALFLIMGFVIFVEVVLQGVLVHSTNASNKQLQLVLLSCPRARFLSERAGIQNCRHIQEITGLTRWHRLKQCQSSLVRRGDGGVEILSQTLPDEALPQIGVFVAKTKIRLRCSPDVASNPNGDAVKPGEMFMVTEVVNPSRPDAIVYLRVGKRGWVFNKGIAGSWQGQAIIMRVPEEEQAEYTRILSDPDTYAQYRELMSHSDYVDRMNAKIDEAYAELGNKDSDKVDAALAWVENKLTEWDMNPANAASVGAEWDRMGQAVASGGRDVDLEKPKNYATIQEELRSDPNLKKYTEDAEIGEQLKRQPASPVAPRWVQLQDKSDMTDEELQAEREWEKKKKRIKELPGGPKALRRKPYTYGRRMGIRVPIVCSPH